MHTLSIQKLSKKEKDTIKTWRYSGEYATFNYAVKEGGWIESYCTCDDSPCYCCMEEGMIIGLFLFIPEKENEFRVLINPEMLNRGYGKRITGAAMDIALKELHYSQISLIVRKSHTVAMSLYQKMGFEIVGETQENIEGKMLNFYRMCFKV